MTNAKFCRNLICAGLGALALSYVPLSHAAYATLSAPLGWSPGAGAAATYSSPVSPAQIAVSELGRINAKAALTVNGGKVAIPVRLPVAASASRVLASRIGVALLVGGSGLVTGGLTVAAFAALPVVAEWFANAGAKWSPEKNSFVKDGDFQYTGGYWKYGFSGQAATAEAACKAINPIYTPGSFSANGLSAYCMYNGQTYDQIAYSGSATKGEVPVPFSEVAPQLEATPLPAAMPNVVWPMSWPVDLPSVQPTFVPTGNPVPNPNYDPAKAPSPTNQPYNQPGVRVVPAPTADNPWQVDLQPVNRPVDSPDAKPQPSPEVNPDGTPKPDQGDMPKEDKDERDLCEKNPDILACQKVDTEVEDAEIPKSQKTVSYQAESIWGGGSCPADKYARVGGQEIKVVDWSRDCQFITDYVRPVTLVVCALIVAGILAGALKP